MGKGAFAKVYAAVRKSDGLKVAIKEIPKNKVAVYEDDIPLEVKQYNKVIKIIYYFIYKHKLH